MKRACEELLSRVSQLGLPDPVNWAEAGRRLANEGLEYVEVEFRLPEVASSGLLDEEDIRTLSPHLVYGSAAGLVRIAVNERTGQTIVEGAVCAVDCGIAVNPAGVKGQTAGGFLQGLGFALMEDYQMIEGVPQTTTLESYLAPTVRDAPSIETVLVENGERTGPFGAKGMAEVVLVPAPPATAAALRDAVGIDVRDLPATAERVYRQMQGRAE